MGEVIIGVIGLAVTATVWVGDVLTQPKIFVTVTP